MKIRQEAMDEGFSTALCSCSPDEEMASPESLISLLNTIFSLFVLLVDFTHPKFAFVVVDGIC